MFEDNREFIFRYLTKLCGNASLAEELTQETFFRAFINLRQLRDEHKASAWLCQIAKNAYFAWHNESKKEAAENSAVAVPTDIGRQFEEKELSTAAHRLLHELSEPYKEVFMLRVFAELSFKEISGLFSKSENWARVTFFRARRRLLERLGEGYDL